MISTRSFPLIIFEFWDKKIQNPFVWKKLKFRRENVVQSFYTSHSNIWTKSRPVVRPICSRWKSADALPPDQCVLSLVRYLYLTPIYYSPWVNVLHIHQYISWYSDWIYRTYFMAVPHEIRNGLNILLCPSCDVFFLVT